MLIEGVGLFQLITQRMDYLSTRHSMIAQNIAHADTPDYSPKDLKPFAVALKTFTPPQMSATNAAHLTATSETRAFAEDRSAGSWEVEPSGNSVSVEEQIIKASDADRDYNLASTLMRKHLTMLRASMNTRG